MIPLGPVPCELLINYGYLRVLQYEIVAIDYSTIGMLQIFYFGFNLVEAIAWFVVALLVFTRWHRHANSGVEIIYGSSYALFGVSDLLELQNLTVWLLLVKGVLLLSILLCRRFVLRHYYTGAKF